MKKLFCGLLAGLITPAIACTDFQIVAKDGSVIVGRTNDLGADNNSQLQVVKAGTKGSVTAPNGKINFSWVSKYSYLNIYSFGESEFMGQAVNDQGLSFEVLWLREAKFAIPTKAEYKKSIEFKQLGPWLLGTSANVDEVRHKLENMVVYADKVKPLGNIEPPFHLAFHDRSGKNIVVEFIDGKINIYNGVGIMTNSPTYDWQLTNIRNYVGLTNRDTDSKMINGVNVSATGHGTGLFGLPGDFTPPSRFIRAGALITLAAPPQNAAQATVLAANVIANVNVPYGVAIEKLANGQTLADYTQWSAIEDLTHMQAYYKAANDLGYTKLDLTKLFAASKTNIVSMSGLYNSVSTDGTDLFLVK